MKRCIFFILILLLGLGFWPSISVACEIDGKLTPELVKYEQEVRQAFDELKKNIATSCGPRSWGGIGQFNKTVELFDRAMLQVPVYGDIVTDFQYNTIMAFRGESRTAVTKNGQIFSKIQRSIIDPTIEFLANRCALNESNETIIVSYIKLNYELESIYKNTAIGTVRNIDTIPEKFLPVAQEIQLKYTPEATKTCKNTYTYEETISKTLDTFSKWTFGIEGAWDNWREAIALFSGKSITRNYDELKRKLLKQEMSRQGMSKNASDIIVSNLDCVQQRKWWDWLDEELRAISDCKQMPIIWVDKLKAAFEKAIQESPTTDVYIERTMRAKELYSDQVNINNLHQSLLWKVSTDIKTNEKIRNTLINMHIRILSTNAILQKRIEPMQKNCMKALPDIIGGCRN